MCPREKQSRTKGVMPLKDFVYLMDLFPPFEGEIHLHGFGEPLLDKTLVEKVAYARKSHPNSTILFFTTLGVPVRAGLFSALADAGLSQLVISCYGFSREAYAQVHGRDTFALVQQNIEQMYAELREGTHSFDVILKGPSPSMVQALALQFQIQTFIQWLSEMGMSYTTETVLHNYGEGREFNRRRSEGVCSIVWGLRREILQITWDLKVIPCCFDFNASIVLGDLREQSLKEIFSSPSYLEFIQAHQEGSLSLYAPCAQCERDFNPSKRVSKI